MSRDRTVGVCEGTFKSYIDPTNELLIDFTNDREEGDCAVNLEEAKSKDDTTKENIDDVFHEHDEDKQTSQEEHIQDGETLLCGYLNKYGGGLLKNMKRRWFVYAENTCKLLYFRTPQDFIPLGEIDISKASFHYDAGREDCLGMFEISSGGKIYYLDAAEKQVMLFWLQELQKKRRSYSHKRTELSQQSVLAFSLAKPQAGLIGEQSSENKNHSENASFIKQWLEPQSPQFLAPIELPCGVVGRRAGDQSSSGLSHFSRKKLNWKTEIRNSMASYRMRRQTTMERSPPVSPIEESIPEDFVMDFPSQIPSDESLGNLNEGQNRNSSMFSTLKRKMTRSKENIKNEDLSPDISLPQAITLDSCKKCSQLERYVVNLKDDLLALEDELEAHRQLTKLMENQIDTLQTEKSTRQEFMLSIQDGEQLLRFQQKGKQISDLEHLIDATKQEKDIIAQDVKLLKSELRGALEENKLYKENIISKDEMLVSLTNRVFELEELSCHNTTVCDTGTKMNTTLLRRANLYDAREVERLKDKVHGYETQNKFLNKEILELNELRAEDDRRERVLIMKHAEMEAKFYQIQSKYLLCLEELRRPQREGENGPSQEMVTQLLHEAIDMDMDATASKSLVSSSSQQKSETFYDQYGFSTLPCYASDDDLISKAHTLQRKSDEITCKIKDVNFEQSNKIKWENYMVSVGAREIQKTPELKALVRAGIPHPQKERIWNACVNFRVGRMREKLGPKYYQNLVSPKHRSGKHNPAAKQIELDLLRTLPTNKHYSAVHSDGIPKLRRVLLAYSWHNPVIGYCQGLNRIVGIALLFLTEEDAFWHLVAVVDHIMPKDYYSSTLIAAQTDQRVLKDLIGEKLPRLHAHLEQNDIDLSLFTFNWFLTVFVDNIAVETYLRIWDAYLYEGNKVLFRFALAFMKFKEEEILRQHGTIAINNYLRGMGEEMTDIKRISQIAFHEINPFPMRHINARRAYHLIQVKAELAELDALRENCRAQRDPHERLSFDFVSDDDL